MYVSLLSGGGIKINKTNIDYNPVLCVIMKVITYYDYIHTMQLIRIKIALNLKKMITIT